LQVLTLSALESWSLLIVFIEIGATARDPDDSRDKEHSEALAQAKPKLAQSERFCTAPPQQMSDS
jgi:hypothetical protein